MGYSSKRFRVQDKHIVELDAMVEEMGQTVSVDYFVDLALTEYIINHKARVERETRLKSGNEVAQ